MKAKLRLYIWDGFNPDWTNGIAFAIAESRKEAQKMVIKNQGVEPYCWGELTVSPLTKKIVRSVDGGG